MIQDQWDEVVLRFHIRKWEARIREIDEILDRILYAMVNDLSVKRAEPPLT